MNESIVLIFIGFSGIAIGFVLSFLNFQKKLQLKENEIKNLAEENQKRQEAAQKQIYEIQTSNQVLQEKVKQWESFESQLGSKFESWAQKALVENGQRMNDINRTAIHQILDPLKEKLVSFERKVEETYANEKGERGTLRGELNKLFDLTQKISSEANHLTRALKGENKTMGNWGEMVLEGILEKSGLRSGEEYFTQGQDMGLENSEGAKLKPDVIVRLPENKHIIIDSKVTLKAFEEYINAESDEQKDKAAKAHLESLERHIRGLSDKKYHTLEGLSSPDFVMLFMPVEPAFALAFKLKPDLLQMAWERNIALVSPTTLLTTLRTVSALWKQERQQKNAEEIAKRGGQLYDKFVLLVEEMTEMGRKIDGLGKSHQEVMKKLSEGNGNLIKQVEKLKELGAKAEKKLPQIE